MTFGRMRLAGPAALFLLGLVACTPEGDVTESSVGVASPSHDVPADAPDFCAALADATDLPRVPGAIGTLALTPYDVESRLYLGNAADEVRQALADVRDDGGHADLENALDDLATSLETAADQPVSDAVVADTVRTLTAAGDRVQPICEFPT